MRQRGLFVRLGIAGLALACVAGCASRESAMVRFAYKVEPNHPLPKGMDTLAIIPAQVGATTDAKWSEMSTAVLKHLINESRASFGTQVTVTERRDMKPIFDESDLAAAGLSTRSGGSQVQFDAANGFVMSNINIKVERHTGKQRTISGLDLAGIGGRGWGGGRANIETQEVETVTRNITVQTEFKLVDATTGQVWDHFMPATYSATDRTKASPFFGSSQTEAALTPVDRIAGTLVEQGAQEFVSRLMKCKIAVDAEITSSANTNCAEGVRMLRAELWDDALSFFKMALAKNPRDHAAAYGAGLACEASGQYNQALDYYRRACAGDEDPTYALARERVQAFGDRASPLR